MLDCLAVSVYKLCYTAFKFLISVSVKFPLYFDLYVFITLWKFRNYKNYTLARQFEI